MYSQTGLWAIWQQGDMVTRSVALILLVMSITTWIVIVVKTLMIRRCLQEANSLKEFWSDNNFPVSISKLGQENVNVFRRLATRAYEAKEHYSQRSGRPGLNDSLNLNEWVTRCLRSSIDESTAQLQAGLAVLATVGSTAPFVGLFGTVWGIYHALMVIGSEGQATIDKVAGPIGEALIMTALGLAVAIPAVLAYNALVRGNKGVLHRLSRFAYDLHALVVTGGRLQSDQLE